jgi:HlyD family secretion protein
MIAEDLSQMEILAAVDESDIGKIAEEQTVRFDVQAYPDKKFTGTVKQIRLQPETVSNVVTYTVVIRAANEENILLPGMTATIDFIIEQREDALLVPNKALRFQPDEKVAAEFFKARRNERSPSPDSTKAGQGARPGGQNLPAPGQGGKGMSKFQKPKDMGQVWYLDQNGKLAMDFVRTGTTDGASTEILMSRHLQQGMKVITGTESNDSKKSSSQNTAPRFGPGGPRPF